MSEENNPWANLRTLEEIIEEEIMDRAKIAQARDLLNEVLNEDIDPPSDNLPPEDQWVWGNGNLWKPISDHGKLVVLLREDWSPTEVWAVKSDGSWENLNGTGRANGNRTHWRGTEPGGRGYANGNRGGGIRVWFRDEFLFIPLPGRSKERYGD